MNKQGLVKIFLNNGSPHAIVCGKRSDQVFNFILRLCKCDAVPSVGVLTGFDDPDVCVFFFLELWVCFWESKILWVSLVRVLDVESKWDCDLERIKTNWTIVWAYISEKCFFVWKMEVVFKSVVNQSRHVAEQEVITFNISCPAHSNIQCKFFITINSFQELDMFVLAPLCPNEVAATWKLLLN